MVPRKRRMLAPLKKCLPLLGFFLGVQVDGNERTSTASMRSQCPTGSKDFLVAGVRKPYEVKKVKIGVQLGTMSISSNCFNATDVRRGHDLLHPKKHAPPSETSGVIFVDPDSTLGDERHTFVLCSITIGVGICLGTHALPSIIHKQS